jgi:hypothetical protein
MGGIFVFIFIVLAKWYESKINIVLRRNHTVLAYIAGISVLSLIVFLVFNQSFILHIVESLFRRSIDSDSSIQLRYYDFYYGLVSALQHPWLGVGMDFYHYNEVLTDSTGINKSSYSGGMTNSIISIFYRYGIFYAGFYLLCLYRYSKYIASGFHYFIFIIMVLMLMHEPLDMTVTVLFFIILFSERIDLSRKNIS